MPVEASPTSGEAAREAAARRPSTVGEDNWLKNQLNMAAALITSVDP